MKNLFSFFKRNKKALNEKMSNFIITNQFQESVEEYMRAVDKPSTTNWVIVRFVKKDSEVLYKVSKFEGQSVQLKNTYYIIDAKSVQFVRVNIYNKKTKKEIGIKVPVIDIYEGRMEAISQEKWANDVKLSEEFQRTVFLELQRGILEAKKKKAATLRQIMVYGFIGLVALVIVGSMLFG